MRGELLHAKYIFDRTGNSFSLHQIILSGVCVNFFLALRNIKTKSSTSNVYS